MEPRDPRAVLGVNAGATLEEIHEAYARTAKRIHPDNFDKGRQPDLWRAANAALAELNEAYAVLSGAARQEPQGEPAQPDFSTSDVAEDCFRTWKPNWGMPDSDYESFLRSHIDMSTFVADILAVMRTKASLTQRDVLGECLAVLGQRSAELRPAMASWYCDRTMAARDGAIREFNAAVRSQPRAEAGRLVDHLTQMLRAATRYLELAAVLDPQGARLREVRSILEADLNGARDARIRAASQPNGVRVDLRNGRPTAAHLKATRPWHKRDWKWLVLIPACICLLIVFAIFQKPGKEDVLRKEFSSLLDAGRNGNEILYGMALDELVARRDTGYISAAISVGSGAEPGLKQAALAYLAGLAQRTSVPQKVVIAGFALQSLASGEEYAKSLARQCLDQFDPAWLEPCLQSSVLSTASSSRFRSSAARELLLRGGTDAVAFLLDHNAEISPAVNVGAVLNDADPYDIVAGSRRTVIAQLPLVLRMRISQAEKDLEASRGASFTQVKVDGLGVGTAQIEIHNEAPVNLYLDLTPTRSGTGFSFMFPARTTRTVAVQAKSYFYRADARRSDIRGKNGAREFDGGYSHVWVFYLEDQRAQMMAKYPDMQFR